MRAFSYIFVATVLARLCSLISFPVTTRTLSVADMGELTIWHSIRGLILLTCLMGLPDIVARHAGLHRNRRAFVVAWRFSTAMVCAMMLGLEVVLRWAPDLVTVAYPRLMLLAALVDIVPGLYVGSLAAMGHVRAYAVCIVTPALVSSVLVVVLVSPPFSLGMLGALSAHLAASVLNAALCIWLSREGISAGEKHETPDLRMLLSQSLPVLGVGLVGMALGSIDRYAIRGLVGAEALGYYAVSLQVAALLSFGGGAVRSSVISKVIANVNDSSLLSRYFNHYLSCGAMFACVLALGAPEIVLILAGARYQTYLLTVPILCVATLCLESFSFAQAVVVAQGRSQRAFWGIAVGAACALLVVPLGTYWAGTTGTALGLLAAYTTAWVKTGRPRFVVTEQTLLYLLGCGLIMAVLYWHYAELTAVRGTLSMAIRYTLLAAAAGMGLLHLRTLGGITAS